MYPDSKPTLSRYAILSFVFGIISWFSRFGFIPVLIFGILPVLFYILARKDFKKGKTGKVLALIGLIMGLVAFFLGLGTYFALSFFNHQVDSKINVFTQSLEEYKNTNGHYPPRIEEVMRSGYDPVELKNTIQYTPTNDYSGYELRVSLDNVFGNADDIIRTK